jgi:hypothetical protein
MIYIMKRTQLYLEENVWNALHARAESEKTTISELVRRAVRERYLGDFDQRREAMQAFVGIRRGRREVPDATQQVRALRRGTRLDRLAKQ